MGENCNQASGNTVQPIDEAGYADWRRGDIVGGNIASARRLPVLPAAAVLTFNSVLDDDRFTRDGEFFGVFEQQRNHPFSSLHAGVNFAFADGHVSHILKSVDHQTLQELGSMNSGGVVDQSGF